MGAVRLATANDAEQVYRLRLRSFSSAREFRLVVPAALRWGGCDRDGSLLIALDDTRTAISTVRGRVAQSRHEAEQWMGCEVDLPATQFPSLVLGRSATAPDWSGSGLNSILRLYFYRAAFALEIRSLLGLVYLGAPRTNQLARIGYELIVPRAIWDDEVDPVTQPLLSHLDRAYLHHAIDALERKFAALLSDFPLHPPQDLETALLLQLHRLEMCDG